MLRLTKISGHFFHGWLDDTPADVLWLISAKLVGRRFVPGLSQSLYPRAKQALIRGGRVRAQFVHLLRCWRPVDSLGTTRRLKRSQRTSRRNRIVESSLNPQPRVAGLVSRSTHGSTISCMARSVSLGTSTMKTDQAKTTAVWPSSAYSKTSSRRLNRSSST